MQKISCAEARQIDMANYLKSLGYQPQKSRGHDVWFCSPFRDEKTASFKVNKARNVWFDFGDGRGGDFIDFGIRFYKCSTSELLQKLSQKQRLQYSFPPPVPAGEKKEQSNGKIVILNDHRLASKPLFEYLKKRCIPIEIAEQFCRQIDFLLYGKKYTAIGFQNDSGGYELRNEYFKGSSSPKDVKFLNFDRNNVVVFEGFFNFLSYQTMSQKKILELPNLREDNANILVLNSLSFFEKSKEKMENHQKIHLFLDRDKAGLKRTDLSIRISKKYIDRSSIYSEFKDLNDHLISAKDNQLKQSHRLGRHF